MSEREGGRGREREKKRERVCVCERDVYIKYEQIPMCRKLQKLSRVWFLLVSLSLSLSLALSLSLYRGGGRRFLQRPARLVRHVRSCSGILHLEDTCVRRGYMCEERIHV